MDRQPPLVGLAGGRDDAEAQGLHLAESKVGRSASPDAVGISERDRRRHRARGPGTGPGCASRSRSGGRRRSRPCTPPTTASQVDAAQIRSFRSTTVTSASSSLGRGLGQRVRRDPAIGGSTRRPRSRRGWRPRSRAPSHRRARRSGVVDDQHRLAGGRPAHAAPGGSPLSQAPDSCPRTPSPSAARPLRSDATTRSKCIAGGGRGVRARPSPGSPSRFAVVSQPTGSAPNIALRGQEGGDPPATFCSRAAAGRAASDPRASCRRAAIDTVPSGSPNTHCPKPRSNGSPCLETSAVRLRLVVGGLAPAPGRPAAVCRGQSGLPEASAAAPKQGRVGPHPVQPWRAVTVGQPHLGQLRDHR